MFSNLVRRPSLSPFFPFCNSSRDDIRETWLCSVSQCFETHEFLFLANFMLGILGCVWGGSPPFRLSPLHGTRIGEAAHPGPCHFKDLRLCVLNPTAVFRKSPAFDRLNVHVLFLAETSATSTTQEIETRELRKRAFETHWGYPVQPCKSDYALPGTAKRGKAAGVAIASQLPTRRVLPPVPVEWDKTCRYAEAWIRMGSLQVLSIVIYAFVDGPDSVTKNAMLLAFACQRASVCKSCVIISGDFNKSLAHESTWANIQQLGFVDALQLARERWPHQVCPTCGGATWNDTLLVRGPLLAYLRDAAVMKDHAFGPHLPFVVTFRAPCQTLSRQVWQLPRDFTSSRMKLQTNTSHHRVNQHLMSLIVNGMPADCSCGARPARQRWLAQCRSRKGLLKHHPRYLRNTLVAADQLYLGARRRLCLSSPRLMLSQILHVTSFLLM